MLARVYYIVRCADGVPADYDLADIEARLVKADARLERRPPRRADRGARGGARGADCTSATRKRSRPATARTGSPARPSPTSPGSSSSAPAPEPILSLYRPLEAPERLVRCKLFSSIGVSLSDVLPTFEHMGAKVVDERPYEISPRERDVGVDL